MSLGVSLTPYKVCSFDCVYCQLGKTTEKTIVRKEYLPIKDILAELRTWLLSHPSQLKALNYITLSGSGEPTLNSGIGELIRRIKKLAALPVAVITNASLLSRSLVRRALLNADLLVPSLDAVDPQIFVRLDRPQKRIKLEQVIAGLVALKKEFPGRIWLEVMLVKGINDDLRHIRRLKQVIAQINPDKIQLNSPVRATTEPRILSVPKGKLEKIRAILGPRCEIV
jgi:wyosine [tRNA(Phe)-imidazoG37] synthetase (radical SAM superfamily)